MDFYEPPAVLQVWPKNPGALARRIRRAQTFLRMLGIVHPRGASGSPDDQDKGIENRPTIVSAAVSNGCHEISIRGGKQLPGLGHSRAMLTQPPPGFR
jgi:hypothetical protein